MTCAERRSGGAASDSNMTAPSRTGAMGTVRRSQRFSGPGQTPYVPARPVRVAISLGAGSYPRQAPVRIITRIRRRWRIA